MKKSVKQTLQKTMAGATTAYVVGVAYATSAYADAADEIIKGTNSTGQQGGTTLETGVETVINLLLFLIGIISVVAIIIGGIRYTTSNGDAGQTKAAKDTILYAVVGLIVALMAYAIVRWVVGVFI